MRRRRLATVLITTLAVGLAAVGCSNSSGSSSGGGDQVTITFATNQITAENDGTSPVLTKLITNFEAQNPGVHIQLQKADGTALQQLIQLRFASRKVPDVFNFWRPQPAFNMDKYIASGQLADVSSLAKEPALRKEFPETSWQTATVNGKVWGLPMVNFSVPLVVNKAIFTKADLPLPTTWQRLTDDVKALKAKGYIPWTVSTMADEQSDERLLDYVLDRELGNNHALALFQGTESFSSPQARKAIADYMTISASKSTEANMSA